MDRLAPFGQIIFNHKLCLTFLYGIVNTTLLFDIIWPAVIGSTKGNKHIEYIYSCERSIVDDVYQS